MCDFRKVQYLNQPLPKQGTQTSKTKNKEQTRPYTRINEGKENKLKLILDATDPEKMVNQHN